MVGVSLPVITLVGATATGKSSLAIELARALRQAGQPAEVVNADSMLVYRGMDIGTAKPTTEEQSGVVHHLIDIMDLGQTASVAVFQELARAAIADCRARGVLPIVVGGSALYLHAIIDQFVFPPTDEVVRARLTGELETIGAEAMYARLQQADPDAAAGIEPANSRRIIRALEAIELSGTFRSTLPTWTYALDNVHQIGLQIDREEMDRRIAIRVEAMWRQGLVKEVRALLDQGLRDSPTACRAIGYRQVIAYLDGTISETEAQQLTIIKTRQFSRKQLSWWKRDPRISWLDLGAQPSAVLALIG
ncbi:MAG: tRNA (adenosine(37)-N6)-dimethylallyltransferase MiaA [Propionibacteriaceae bacterium]|jgi:tRNA dimethylallyltransferase|nr:tRNA (adenosine(37)-N6)-dimethylallyltransferase MiaA [Propionibacteriaceae bacterium]